MASPGYFAALGQRVLDGRVFSAEDARDDAPEVVINDLLECE